MSATVAVVGGGLAGLAAACALADAGFRITLLERRPYLGGRASSYEHPGTGEVVDNCQHVLLGCCTNLVDFYRRIGAGDKIRWYQSLVFVEPGGRRSVLEPGLLPAPFHAAGSFLRAPALSPADKTAIARAMFALASSLPADDRPFLDWLRAHHQTERAIERFWKVVLVSALNEDLDRASSRYAAMVFRESFLKSAAAGAMGLPAVPLTELYSSAGDYIRARGGEVRLRANVEAVQFDGDRVRLCADERRRRDALVAQDAVLGNRRLESHESRRDGPNDLQLASSYDYAVLAAPWHVVSGLLPDEPAAESLRAQIARLEPSPITGVHFWFDRQVTDLDHAVLLDRTIQWMFHKSRIFGRTRPNNCHSERSEEAAVEGASYLELVISSSKDLVRKSREEILDLALRELAEFFPEVKNARVLKSAVIKEVNATFAPLPGGDSYRPPQTSPWPRVFLAGDWTRTGWPATMEGAVRSGYLAAEALCAAAGTPRRWLVPDLPPAGLMRLFR
jgi:squalene-associated FAD-dependent desaturase